VVDEPVARHGSIPGREEPMSEDDYDDDIVTDDDIAREKALWHRLARITGSSEALATLLFDGDDSPVVGRTP
jgi:hypothetical protein